MPILQVRIDDRLIHGQVVDGWLKPLSITQVLVVSERHSKEPMQKTLLEVAATESVSVQTLGISDSIQWLKVHQASDQNLMILATSPADILQLLEGGIRFPSVVLGGLHSPEHKVKVSPSIMLTDPDCQNLKKIARYGVLLHAQTLPTERAESISELMLN